MSTPRDVAVLVGSLRKDSLNRKVARVLARLAPASLKLEIVQIGSLPLYNADDDEGTPPVRHTAPLEEPAAHHSP